MKRTVADIRRFIGSKNCKVIGDVGRTFSGVRPLFEAKGKDLTFCVKKDKDALPILEKTRAGVIICDFSVLSKDVDFGNKTLVAVDKPRLWFIRCLNEFFPVKSKTGIHPTAVIGKSCCIGKYVYIGPNVYVGDAVAVGDRTKIHSGVQIHDRVNIGKNVVLKSGCIIGSDGFGYERDEEEILQKFPHFGSVIIEDDVEVGGNTCVDRGTLSNTIVGRGTKIDNLVHIAHNVVIGTNCVVIALAMIGGGARIGDGAWIAPTACVRDGVTIGKHALVGMGAVVTKNVADGDIVMGVPAKSIKGPTK